MAPSFWCRHCERSLQNMKAYMGSGARQPQADSQANALPLPSSSIVEPKVHDAVGELHRSTAAASRWPAAVDPACVSAAESANDTAVGGPLVRLLTSVQSESSKHKSRKKNSSRRREPHRSSRKDEWLASLYGAAAKALRDEPRVVEVAVDVDAIVREALAWSGQPDAILREGNSPVGHHAEEQELHSKQNGARTSAAPHGESQPTTRKPTLLKIVPASMSMASAWWVSSATEHLTSGKTDAASSHPEIADQPRTSGASTEDKAFQVRADNAVAPKHAQMIAVTEVHDMRAFGVRRSANIIAFRHQKACGGLYVPWLLSTNEATLETVVCDAAILRLISRVMVDGPPSRKSESIWPFLTGRDNFIWKGGRLVQAAYNIQKGFRETVAKKDIQNIGVALNRAILKTPESLPTIFAFGAHLLECRATLPSQDRKRNGYPALKAQEVPEFQALTHLDEEGAEVLIPVGAPERFQAPVRPPDDRMTGFMTAGAKREAAERRKYSGRRRARMTTAAEPWRLPLYKAFAVLCYFSLHLYHLGERPFDYMTRHVDDIFPRPWRVGYVGTVAWTEMTPFWSPKGELTPGGQRMFKKYKLTLKPRWRLPFGGWRQAISAGKDSPKATHEKLRPFSVDFCMHDAAYACEDRSPMFVRLERRSELHRSSGYGFNERKARSAQRSRQQTASGSLLATAKNLMLHLYTQLLQYPHSRANPAPVEEADGAPQGRRGKETPREQRTTSKEKHGEENRIGASAPAPANLPLHQADTLWLFKGTDNAKTWTINLMMEAIRDETFSSTGFVHQGFATLFHNVLRRPMTRFLREAAYRAAGRAPETPYVVVLSGHSLGGALSTLAAWFLAKNLKYFVDKGTLVIYCVSFGAPSIGDRAAVEELEASGLKIFRVLADADPVPFIGQTEGFTELYKSSKEIVLHLDDMRNVVIRGADGRLVFSGATWLEDGLQPGRTIKRFLRLATATLNLSQFIRSHSNPLATHLHFVPCALSIMTGTFVQNGWSSFCASPLLGGWLHSPNVLASEDELEMKRVHERVLPQILKKMENR